MWNPGGAVQTKLPICWLAAVLLCGTMLTFPQRLRSDTSTEKKRPNVILLLADDLNYDLPGFMGGQAPELTLNLDRFAAAGIVFTHCYNATSICGPSRAAMMTGLYPQSNGDLGHNRPIPAWWENRNRDRKISSLATYLRAHGYFAAKMDKAKSQPLIWHQSEFDNHKG